MGLPVWPFKRISMVLNDLTRTDYLSMTSFRCDDAQQIGPDVPHHLGRHHIRINVNGLKGQVRCAPREHLVWSGTYDAGVGRIVSDPLVYYLFRHNVVVLVFPQHNKLFVCLFRRRKVSTIHGFRARHDHVATVMVTRLASSSNANLNYWSAKLCPNSSRSGWRIHFIKFCTVS